VNAYGSPDHSIYPHMQLLINGAIAGEWDVTGTAQNYTVTTAPLTGQLPWNANGTLQNQNITDAFNTADNKTAPTRMTTSPASPAPTVAVPPPRPSPTTPSATSANPAAPIASCPYIQPPPTT